MLESFTSPSFSSPPEPPPVRSTWTLQQGDCREWLASLACGSLDAVVTDPPYHIGTASTDAIMPWDRGDIAFDPAFWTEVRRVTAVGGHLAAFGHPRRAHRLAVAMEDAGWTLTEPIYWAHAHVIRKHPGALKPGATPIIVARNRGRAGYPGIEATRLATGGVGTTLVCSHAPGCKQWGWRTRGQREAVTAGEVRTHYKAYVKPHEQRNIDDGRLVAPAWTCVEGCPVREIESRQPWAATYFSSLAPDPQDEASAIFYAGRPGGSDIVQIDGQRHPTQKPLSLLSFLVQLLSEEGQVVGDPFAGSATTGAAALAHGRRFAGAEGDPVFYRLALKRLSESTRRPASEVPATPSFSDLVGRLFDPDATTL